MPKTTRPRDPVILPPVGSTFAVPLGNGLYSACRVVRHDDTMGFALVVGSGWVGTAVPGLDEPRLREPLILSHHSWKNVKNPFFAVDNVPDDSQFIGTIPPLSEDLKLERTVLTSWESVRIQALLQWRWEHDREALVAEEAAKRAHEKEVALEMQRQRQEYLAAVTLGSLREKHRFESWEGAVSGGLIEACRGVFRDTIDDLMQDHGKVRKTSVTTALRGCVQRLNELDAEHRFIETVEREDLCQEIDEIACACGVPDVQGIADHWREW